MKKIKLYEVIIDLSGYGDSGILIFTAEPTPEDVVKACSALVLEAASAPKPDPDDYDGYEADEIARSLEFSASLREAAERMKPLDGETGTQDLLCAGVTIGRIQHRTLAAWER